MITHTSEKMTDQEVQLYKDGQRLGLIVGLLCGVLFGICLVLVISTIVK